MIKKIMYKNVDPWDYAVYHGEDVLGHLLRHPDDGEWYFNPSQLKYAFCEGTMFSIANVLEGLNDGSWYSRV